MKIVMAYTALVLSSGIAYGDQRIHQTPQAPLDCKGVSPPSGYCVRGPTYYRLDGGLVRWVIDKTDPVENPEFWREADKWGGGTNNTSSDGGSSK